MMKKASIKWALLLIVLFFGQFALRAQSISDLRDLIESEKYNAGLDIADKVITANVKDPEAYYLAGLLNFQVDKLESAKEYFAQGIKVKSKYPLNHVGMARVLQKMGKKEEADAVFAKVMEYNRDDDPDVLIELGQAYLEGGKDKIKEAETLLLRAQNKAPENPKSYIALGDMYRVKKIPALALPQYLRAIEVDPNYIDGYLRVGQLKIEAEDYKDGLEYLNSAIKLNPVFAPAYKERGQLYARAKQYDFARDDFKKYVELTNGDIQARIRYCGFLYLTEDYEGTIREVQKLLDEGTESNVLLRLIGYSYAETGNTEKALDYMDTYFSKINPEFVICDDFECYGTIMRKMGRFDQAEESYLRAFKLDSSRTKILEKVAEMYEKNQDFEKAVLYREQHLNSKPKKKLNDWLNLGLAYYRAGVYAKADSSFSMVIELKDDYYVGYYWKAASKVRMEKMNGAFGTAVPEYQKVVKLLEAEMEKDDDLKKKETSRLVTAYEYLAYYFFNPSTVEGDYHCDDALPYIGKVMELDPQSVNIRNLQEYCESAVNGN